MTDLTLAPNKYPGTCFYCAKRVRKGDGCCWPDAAVGRYACAHTDCVSAAVARGKGPQLGVVVPGGVAPSVQAESRAAVGLSPAARTAAATLKALRTAIQRVMVTSPENEIMAALADARALLSADVVTMHSVPPF